MARTTYELWLEDRQEVLDRCRDRTWWRWMHWCISVGLLLAVVRWGWVGPSVVVLSCVAASVLLFVAHVGRVDLAEVRVVVDLAALTVLAAVGAVGLVAAWPLAGLIVVLVLTSTSPVVRRSVRDARTGFRLSVVLAREARRRPGFLP